MALKIPLRWLRDFVDYPGTPAELADTLTIAGLEVDGNDVYGDFWDDTNLVIGEITTVLPHPDADSLCLVTIRYGQPEPLTVVTGAPNLLTMVETPPAIWPKIPLALVGAQVLDAYSEERKLKKLKPSKIRGIPSAGMACSERELGLSDEHEGVLLLPDDAPVGRPLREYLSETVLHFDIKGGFSHLLCILGIARETAAIYGLPLQNAELLSLPDSQHIVEQTDYVQLQIDDPDLCSRYTAFRISGVRVGPSPFWMQQRLRQCGMRPINNIVDITNYVMLELGQPLHAFDYQALAQRSSEGIPRICIRRAKPNELLTTLDNVERKLDPEMLLITDEQGPIAIAGVMGGGNTEVSEETTEILLEAAHFEFLNNRRTSQLLKLKTEAAERFGKRLDPELPMQAGWRAARLIAELTEGVLEPVVADLYPRRPEPVQIELDANYVERILGIQLSEAEIVRILTALEFGVTSQERGRFQVQVPAHRQDVRIPADLVEELVRIHGYNKLPSTRLADELPPQRENLRLLGVERVRDLLVSAGLDEVITYSLTSPEEEAKLKLQVETNEGTQISLLNPLSQERSHLRQTLIVGLLQTARDNLRMLPRIQVFEVGSIFLPREGELLPEEPRRLALLLTGARLAASWHHTNPGNFDFFDLKGRLEILLNGLHLNQPIRWEQSQTLPYHPGRCARLMLGSQELGTLGELHPQIRQEFGLPAQSVCVAELNLDLLLEHWQQAHQMNEISGFTPIYEDLALVVDQETPASHIQEEMLQVGQPLLQHAVLFDVYTGEQVPANKKSLAYALTFQAVDRTLQDKDVEKVRQKIIRRLEQTCGAQLRV